MPLQAQHYVPQVYLRNFATQRKKEFFICCFDKATRKTFKPNIKGIAAQTKLYDFTTQNGEKVSIENFFNDTESKIKLALDMLIAKPTISVLLENSQIFAKFFALQEFRTPLFNDEQTETIRLVNERLGIEKPFFPEPTENDKKEFQAKFLVDMANFFANTLLKMKWILVSNKTNMPFWTSDNPIIRHNPHKEELIGNLGLESPGIQLHIPITPALAVIICDPFEYSNKSSELPAFTPNIDFNNSGQILHSQQYIFSPNENFALANEMLHKYPDLSNPNRPRTKLAS